MRTSHATSPDTPPFSSSTEIDPSPWRFTSNLDDFQRQSRRHRLHHPIPHEHVLPDLGTDPRLDQSAAGQLHRDHPVAGFDLGAR